MIFNSVAGFACNVRPDHDTVIIVLLKIISFNVDNVVLVGKRY